MASVSASESEDLTFLEALSSFSSCSSSSPTLRKAARLARSKGWRARRTTARPGAPGKLSKFFPFRVFFEGEFEGEKSSKEPSPASSLSRFLTSRRLWRPCSCR